MFLTAFKEQADAAFKMIQVADDEVRVKRVREIPLQLDVFHRYLFADLLTYLTYLPTYLLDLPICLLLGFEVFCIVKHSVKCSKVRAAD